MRSAYHVRARHRSNYKRKWKSNKYILAIYRNALIEMLAAVQRTAGMLDRASDYAMIAMVTGEQHLLRTEMHRNSDVIIPQLRGYP